MVRYIVHRNVIAGLEKPHLANSFSANARHGDVGDGSGRKLETGICGVDSLRNYRNTHGVQARYLNFFSDQPLHDIEIVDHQVEHYIDVQRPGRKLTNAMNLEINGIADM